MQEKKKDVKDEPKDLWIQQLVKPITISQYAKDIAETEKIIVFGESNSGKTTFYISILEWLEKQGLKKEELLMCIIYPDRPTGLTKLFGNIPEKYRDNIMVFPIDSYEELVSSTAQAEKALEEHKKKTGKFGWLVIELLEDAWKSAQDYYCRLAYGETLGEYFAKKRADVKAMKEDNTAYKALEGWGDWPIIKYFHNFNWIDKIKRMQYNVIFTSELKAEGNKDSIFFDLGYRPAGEKDNMHRVDTIIYLSHKENKFQMRPYKLTGFKRLYGQIDITIDQKHHEGAYTRHKNALKRLEELGYKQTPMDELEKEAGIESPKTESKKEEKTIKVVSKGEDGKEKEEKISKEKLTEKPKKEEKKEEPKEEEGDLWSI